MKQKRNETTRLNATKMQSKNKINRTNKQGTNKVEETGTRNEKNIYDKSKTCIHLNETTKTMKKSALKEVILLHISKSFLKKNGKANRKRKAGASHVFALSHL